MQWEITTVLKGKQPDNLAIYRLIQVSKSMGLEFFNKCQAHFSHHHLSIHFQPLTQNISDIEHTYMPNDSNAEGWNGFLKNMCQDT